MDKVKVLTLYAMLLKKEKLSEQSEIFFWLKQKKISQLADNKAFFYNMFCFFKRFFFQHPIIKYYYIQHIKSNSKAAYIMSEYNRALFLKVELLRQQNFLNILKNNWFVYYPYEFNFYVIPYRNYFIRLDIFSFFYLWNSLENLRTILYNHYIISIENLWKRPVIRRALINHWYERRLVHLHLGKNSKKHYNYKPVRMHQRLNAIFFVMFFWRKRYALYNFVLAKKHRYNLMVSSQSHLMAQINAKIHQFLALSSTVKAKKKIVNPDETKVGFYMLGNVFFTSWALEIAFLNLFLFFMRTGTRLPFHEWEITRYHKYLNHVIRRVKISSTVWYFHRVIYIRYRSFFKRLLNKTWLSKEVLNHFMLQDFYHYTHRTINQIMSFLDTRFYYKILSLKLNMLFNFKITYLTSIKLEDWHVYIRPFQGFAYLKGKKLKLPNLRIKRAMRRLFPIKPKRLKLFNYARHFLTPFLTMPVYYTYAIVGLEYYRWRIFSVNDNEKWLNSKLHYAYYFIKLDVDSLNIARNQSFNRIFVDRAINDKDMRLWFSDRFIQKSEEKHWPVIRYPNERFFIDPWMVVHFDAYRDFFTIAFHQSIKLSIIYFFLVEEFKLINYDKYYFYNFAKKKIDLLLRLNECFLMYVYVNEKIFPHLKPDFYRKRRTKTPWVAPLTDDEKLLPPDQIGMRYCQGFKWTLHNLPAWMEKKKRWNYFYKPDKW
jgi:hypothetical protein